MRGSAGDMRGVSAGDEGGGGIVGKECRVTAGVVGVVVRVDEVREG